MKQSTIHGFDFGLLKDGSEIREGNIVRYEIAGSVGFSMVVLNEGKLCMENNFMYGEKTPIDHFLAQAGYNKVKRVSVCDVYRFCKSHGWDVGYYMKKFGKK